MDCFLISNDGKTLIATLSSDLAAGDCNYGFESTKEELNANFSHTLVNAKKGKISYAKKWAIQPCERSAKVVDPYFPRDFIVS